MCVMSSKQLQLSPTENALYQLLKSRKDVAYSRLYSCLARPRSALTSSEHQSAIAPFISRLNIKLAARNLRVGLGRLRHTYRLTRIAD